ncbi:hypothetical protein J6590_091587 [Homalodisca vitripennis]|nr:hypothetical protein J6590_091587 [Homalodisca vitripennis]
MKIELTDHKVVLHKVSTSGTEQAATPGWEQEVADICATTIKLVNTAVLCTEYLRCE